jgi:hypothetical protein
MALRDVLGLYSELDEAIAGVDKLAEIGIHREDFEVLSNAPYPEGAFGHDHSTSRLGLWPVVGACCGFAVGLLVTGGTQVVYPMVTDGKPLFSIPPMVVIMYEGTMLAAVIFTVLGAIFESRLPRFVRDVYDTRITDGYVGILVHAPEERLDSTIDVLRSTGAEDVKLAGAAGSGAGVATRTNGKGARA